jgi:hypothetical protein
MQDIGEKYYVRIGRATDLKKTPDYATYRLLEIMPGALVWLTFAAMIAASYWLPAWAAGFMILFSTFWFLGTVYLSLHLRASFAIMRKNLATDWRAKLEQLPITNDQLPVSSWRDIWQAIIVPVYNESYEIIRSSMASFRRAGWPAERTIIVLTAEERSREGLEKAVSKIEQEFAKDFAHFLVTWHPAGLAGEIAGKGSNEAWAGKELLEKIVRPNKIPEERVIVSVFDADTSVEKGFFDCLAHHYLTAEKPLRSSFQPVPLFVNNVWYAPAFARVIGFSSTFWQMMQQARPERLITFSSHSMPLKALVEIGFWQPNVVSEDSRIFYQCFLFYDGDWQVVPMNFPVMMDANFAGTFWGTLKNQYKQQRRWGYGAENIPYLLYGILKNKLIPRQKKWGQAINIVGGFHSWATNSILLFCLGWLPLVIGQDHLFRQSVLSFSLPQITQWIMTFAMVGLVTSAVLSIALLPPRPPQFGKWKMALMILQWFLLPFTIIFLSAIPAIEAQTRLMLGRYMGFWSTPKVRRPETRKGVGEKRQGFPV